MSITLEKGFFRFDVSPCPELDQNEKKVRKTNKVNITSLVDRKQEKKSFFHSPLLPKRFIPPKEHKKHPSSIMEVMHWYHGTYMAPKLYQSLYKHLHKARMIRSEFREMISMGCAILTYYFDVKSNKIGFYDVKGRWVNITYHMLSNKLAVSIERVKRFFKFLKDRNFIEVKIGKKPRKDNPEKFITVATKTLKPSFFINTLGIKAWKKLQSYKEYLTKKAKPIKKENQENIGLLKGLFKIAAETKNIIKKPFSRPVQAGPTERQLMDKANQLHERDPSKSKFEWYKYLKLNPV